MSQHKITTTRKIRRTVNATLASSVNSRCYDGQTNNQEAYIMTKQEAVTYFGGPVALARALGIVYQSVLNWKDPLPMNRQRQIQLLSGGRLIADASGDSHEDKVTRLASMIAAVIATPGCRVVLENERDAQDDSSEA